MGDGGGIGTLNFDAGSGQGGDHGPLVGVEIIIFDDLYGFFFGGLELDGSKSIG